MGIDQKRPAELILLRLIEAVWDSAVHARRTDDVDRLSIALEDLYRLHGEPFGSSRAALVLWLEHGRATTVN